MYLLVHFSFKLPQICIFQTMEWYEVGEGWIVDGKLYSAEDNETITVFTSPGFFKTWRQ